MIEHRQALPPETILLDNFKILEVLGQGGFGITYRARDLGLDADVAIKEYFPDSLAMRDSTKSVHAQSTRKDADYEKGLKRFIREMRSLNQFRNDNIIRIRSIFRQNNTAYAVLDFEEGLTLATWGNSLRGAPGQDLLDRISRQLLAALNTVHAQRIMHRDISPDNIIIRPNGSPVLIDFGSARLFQSEGGESSSIIVKHGYSPPEQYQAANPERQGPPTDIYALGATLYYMVTAQPPAKAHERENEVLNRRPDPLRPARELAIRRDYRPEFLSAIDAALQLRESDRPQNVNAWAAQLLEKGHAAPAAPVNRIEPASSDDVQQEPMTPLQPLRSQRGTSVLLDVMAFSVPICFVGFYIYPQWQSLVASGGQDFGFFWLLDMFRLEVFLYALALATIAVVRYVSGGANRMLFSSARGSSPPPIPHSQAPPQRERESWMPFDLASLSFRKAALATCLIGVGIIAAIISSDIFGDRATLTSVTSDDTSNPTRSRSIYDHQYYNPNSSTGYVGSEKWTPPPTQVFQQVKPSAKSKSRADKKQ